MEKLTETFTTEELARFYAWRDSVANYASEHLGFKAANMVLMAEDDELAPYFIDSLPLVAVVARLTLSRLDALGSATIPAGSVRATALPKEMVIRRYLVPNTRRIGLRERALRILNGYKELFF